MEVTIEDGVNGGVIEDSQISKAAPDGNFSTSTNMQIATLSAISEDKGIIRVDLSSLPSVTPLAAYFGFDIWLLQSTKTVRSYGLIQTFEGPKVTWNSYSTGNTWDTPGAEGEGTDRIAAFDQEEIITSIDSDYHFPVSNDLTQSYVGDWLSLILEDPGSFPVPYALMRSTEATSGNKPYFYMEYTEEAVLGRRRKIVQFRQLRK